MPRDKRTSNPSTSRWPLWLLVCVYKSVFSCSPRTYVCYIYIEREREREIEREREKDIYMYIYIEREREREREWEWEWGNVFVDALSLSLSVWQLVCVYVGMHEDLYVCLHVHQYVCIIYVCVHASVCTCLSACACVHVCLYSWVVCACTRSSCMSVYIVAWGHIPSRKDNGSISFYHMDNLRKFGKSWYLMWSTRIIFCKRLTGLFNTHWDCHWRNVSLTECVFRDGRNVSC